MELEWGGVDCAQIFCITLKHCEKTNYFFFDFLRVHNEVRKVTKIGIYKLIPACRFPFICCMVFTLNQSNLTRIGLKV